VSDGFTGADDLRAWQRDAGCITCLMVYKLLWNMPVPKVGGDGKKKERTRKKKAPD